jgi:hypothetical protein
MGPSQIKSQSCCSLRVAIPWSSSNSHSVPARYIDTRTGKPKCQHACGLSPGKDWWRLRTFRCGTASPSRRSTATLNWLSSTATACMHSPGRAAASFAAGAMRRLGAGLALSLHIGASGRDCPRQCIDRQPPDGAGPKRRNVTYDYIRTSDAPDITIHTYNMFFPRANPRRIEHRATGVTISGGSDTRIPSHLRRKLVRRGST